MPNHRMHPYATKLVSFKNFYDTVFRFDPGDFSGRQTAYTDDFVTRMPPDSGAKKLHDEVLALHERTEELVLSQRDYWDGPGESCDFRFLVVENVPAYKESDAYDLGIWLPDMLSCVESLNPFYEEDEGTNKYFFSDDAKREQLVRDLNGLSADIKKLMERIGV